MDRTKGRLVGTLDGEDSGLGEVVGLGIEVALPLDGGDEAVGLRPALCGADTVPPQAAVHTVTDGRHDVRIFFLVCCTETKTYLCVGNEIETLSLYLAPRRIPICVSRTLNYFKLKRQFAFSCQLQCFRYTKENSARVISSPLVLGWYDSISFHKVYFLIQKVRRAPCQLL